MWISGICFWAPLLQLEKYQKRICFFFKDCSAVGLPGTMVFVLPEVAPPGGCLLQSKVFEAYQLTRGKLTASSIRTYVPLIVLNDAPFTPRGLTRSRRALDDLLSYINRALASTSTYSSNLNAIFTPASRDFSSSKSLGVLQAYIYTVDIIHPGHKRVIELVCSLFVGGTLLPGF